MDSKDSLIMGETSFLIALSEYNNGSNDLFNPAIIGISPTWSNDAANKFGNVFELKDYRLYLKSFIVSSDRGYPTINGIKPEPYSLDNCIDMVSYHDVMEPIRYTGAIVIVNTIAKNYGNHDEIPCYSYKLVKELIFHDGKLVTTIDHSKAMQRIRKNIDLGLRNLNKKQDIKCIQRFIKVSFVGDYHSPKKRSIKKQNTFPKVSLNLGTYLKKFSK